ncbi:nucleotidyltransferase domain-containing protein [Bacillus sp. B1-b2]|uniref:nucleotidyltransferase domain-containing protein n=1 Tax=Bacillus sp. B1-b2 TaxID=2653201 RepID=UPI001261DE84|nr:nucleotidyltransferase domain-containing protein [Bacillus sp. B1-b2]KAB7663644.1 nucleotidyltransferase domain-containing protein [Bacillus sp. B1-b2]
MDSHIKDVIQQIEKEFEVRVLYACESGSRAWGFPSKDSDYDVRFIYIHKKDWYLSIDQNRDVIEIPSHDSLSIPIDPLLDVSGWELTKALKLFRKSNPPLLEWLQSHLVYYHAFSTIEKMRTLEKNIISPLSIAYHYLNMARGNYRDYLLGDNVKIKKYFYVLRPVLAAKWVQKYQTVPPMEFEILVNTLIPESPLKQEILHLLQRKKAGEELKLEARIQSINEYLDTEIKQLENYVKTIKQEQIDCTAQLNTIFRETLDEVWS